MGEKGARRTEAATRAAAELVAVLVPLGEVGSRPMFGGFGVFAGGVMFAIVDPDGRWFLRADADDAAQHEAAGRERHGRMPYWSVPDEVRAEEGALLHAARAALAVARTARR